MFYKFTTQNIKTRGPRFFQNFIFVGEKSNPIKNFIFVGEKKQSQKFLLNFKNITNFFELIKS